MIDVAEFTKDYSAYYSKRDKQVKVTSKPWAQEKEREILNTIIDVKVGQNIMLQPFI